MDYKDIFSNKNLVRPTEEEIIANSQDDTLYTSKFDQGRYLNIQTDASKQFDFEASPKIRLSLVYITEKNDTASLVISRFKEKGGTYTKDGEIKLSNFDLAKLRDFLSFLQGLDLKSITERKIRLADSELEIDEDLKKKIRTLLSSPEGLEMVQEIIKSGAINSRDIINIGYRKEQLQVFSKLLNNPSYIDEYKRTHSITRSGGEAVWQFFFQNNQWIFGYGLKYQFLSMITDQPNYGGQNVTGGGSQIGDYLMATEAEKRFTVLVEIKIPEAQIVGSEIRSGVHKIGQDLVDGISQLQVNCQTWEIEGSRTETNREHAETNKYYTYEPKGILVIGSTKQLDSTSKRKTFDVFRNNLRNPEVITFDELYERAKFIVEHASS